MYTGNIAARRARLARAYDKADQAHEYAFIFGLPLGVDLKALYQRREAIWKAYKRFGIES